MSRLFSCSAMLLLLSVTNAVAQPSFDCSKSTRPDELTICASHLLSTMDNIVNNGYLYLRATLAVEAANRLNLPFIKARQNCLSDEHCILNSQIAAIQAFRANGAPVDVPDVVASYLTTQNAPAGARVSAPDSSLTLMGDNFWVVLASRQSLDEAIAVANHYIEMRPMIAQTSNGWYAVIHGPISVTQGTGRATLDALIKSDGMPQDAFLTKGPSFLHMVWKAPEPSPPSAATTFQGIVPPNEVNQQSTVPPSIPASAGPIEEVNRLPCSLVTQDGIARQPWFTESASPFGIPFAQWDSETFAAFKARFRECGGNSALVYSELRYIDHLQEVMSKGVESARREALQRQSSAMAAAREGNSTAQPIIPQTTTIHDAQVGSQAPEKGVINSNGEQVTGSDAPLGAASPVLSEVARVQQAPAPAPATASPALPPTLPLGPSTQAISPVPERRELPAVAHPAATIAATATAAASPTTSTGPSSEAESPSVPRSEAAIVLPVTPASTPPAPESRRPVPSTPSAVAQVDSAKRLSPSAPAISGQSRRPSDGTPMWFWAVVVYAALAGLITLPTVRPPFARWYNSSTWFIFGTGPVDILVRQIGYRLGFEVFVYVCSCLFGAVGGAIFVVVRLFRSASQPPSLPEPMSGNRGDI